jgi:putative lipoic acid-binding regulatory protein
MTRPNILTTAPDAFIKAGGKERIEPMMNEGQIIQFPCMFPVKVMGLNTDEFSSAVMAVFGKHVDMEQTDSSQRTSSGGKYLSITVTFMAQSSAQLNDIYEELNDLELVLMTL